jgi:crotonobetainyl-CoA:carnitine CoA-transferase CaiB-like acyl-CoA transferase
MRMEKADTRVGPYAAALGEHTREVLRDAGLADAEIDRLIPSGT